MSGRALLLASILLFLISAKAAGDPAPTVRTEYWEAEGVVRVSFEGFPWPLSSLLPGELTFNLSGGNGTFYLDFPVVGRVKVEVIVHP